MSGTERLTVATWLAQAAEGRQGQPALAGIDGAPTLSHAELLEFVADAGRDLNDAGIGRGDVVLLALPDGPMALTAFLAITSVAVACPVAAQEHPEEYVRVLDEVGARAILMGDRPHAALTRIAEERGLVLLRITRRPDAAAGVFDLRASRPAPPCPEYPPNPDDDALYSLTSGTSAVPKVVAWTQTSLWQAVRAFRDWFGFTADDRSLCMMPIAHAHSLVRSSLPVLAAGGSVIWTPGFDPRHALDWVDRFAPTYMSAVPAIYRRLLERCDAIDKQPSVSTFRLLGVGSDMIDEATTRRLAERFGAKIVQFYGLSETCPFIAATPASGPAGPPGSVGRIHPIWTAVCLDEGGRPVAPGEPGEIAVAGGIINRLVGQTYSQRITADGRLRTGDIGRVDADGFLFVEGRVDDVINRGGQKTHPRAVEAAIGSHPAVRKVVAFAIPDPILGSRVAAAVEVHEGKEANAAELLEHAARRLKSYMVPERLILTPQIPVNRAGKVSRKDLAALFAGVIDTRDQTTGHGDGLARMIADIFRNSLRCGQVDPSAGFFELGGDSLAALEVLLAIEERFHVSVPPATFMRLQSAADLARYISDYRRQKGQAELVRVQHGHHPTPLVIAHGVDGRVSFPASLAQGLGPAVPLMVLHARGRALAERDACDLPALTLDYADLISEQARPPYALAGHSFGAHAALGIAQHLLAQGAAVAFLGILDDEADLHKRLFGVAHSPLAAGSTRAFYRHALALSPAAPYQGDIVYFRAAENDAYYRSDPTSGWSEIALGNVTIVDVEGNHHSIVAEAGLRQLGPLIREELERARSRPVAKIVEVDEMRRVRFEARLAGRRGDLVSELQYYRTAIELDPEQPSWVYANLAEALLLSGEMEDGLRALDEALGRDRWPLSIHLRFAPLFVERRLEAHLARALDQSRHTKVDHPSVLEQQGRVALIARDAPASESLFRRGLEMAPHHLTLRSGLAQALRRQKRFAEVVRLLAETIEQNPSVDWLAIWLGRAYIDVDSPAAALDILQRAALAADRPASLLVRGRALEALGRLSEAAGAFMQASEMEPDRADAAHRASDALESLGRHDEALAYARRAAACAKTRVASPR